MDDNFRASAVRNGYQFNTNGGVYNPGKNYDHIKKLEVESAILHTQSTVGNINKNAIARKCGVGWHYVKKIETEMEQYGRVVTPEEVKLQNSIDNRGAGAKTLNETDMMVLLQLYFEEPSRNLGSYMRGLYRITGTIVSTSTLSRLFKEVGMTLCRPNLIPMDKFRPDNEFRAVEYVYMIARINPSKLKFGDEKGLAGKEVYKRNVRRNPFNGLVPPLQTNPDFTKNYSLTGFCGIDDRSSAVFCIIHEEINDATEFALQLELAINSGFFHRGDVLVLDNAAIHIGGENTVLEEWLWSNFEIFLLLLPPRSPEWNPIELVWGTMVVRLKHVPLYVLEEIGSHATAVESNRILSEITHDEVRRFYKKCNIF
jgi:transposase